MNKNKYDQLEADENENAYNEISNAVTGHYKTPYAFKKRKNNHAVEAFLTQIKEISYADFKSDPNYSYKQKINKSIQEISKQLYEIDRTITRVNKLKTEIGADQRIFLKSTFDRFLKINERLLKISAKIREINK